MLLTSARRHLAAAPLKNLLIASIVACCASLIAESVVRVFASQSATRSRPLARIVPLAYPRRTSSGPNSPTMPTPRLADDVPDPYQPDDSSCRHAPIGSPYLPRM